MFYRFCKFLLNIAMLLYIFAANKWSIHNILYILPLQMLVTKMIKHTHNDCLLDECLLKTATYKKEDRTYTIPFQNLSMFHVYPIDSIRIFSGYKLSPLWCR